MYTCGIQCGARRKTPRLTRGETAVIHSEDILEIDVTSPTPVHRQIANALRALLVTGIIPAGNLLPTVRQLAMNLGINHNTVADAYRILADEGWLSLKRRRGALVLQRPVPPLNSEAGATFSRRLSELLAEARTAGVIEVDLQERLRSASRGLRQEGRGQGG